MKKSLLLAMLVLIGTQVSQAQIKMNSNGHIGIGGSSASSSYDINTTRTNSTQVYSTYSKVSGNMGIGTSWSFANRLKVSGLGSEASNYTVYIGGGGSTYGLYVAGNIKATGTITPSDRRLKKNIKTIDHETLMQKISKIKGRTYEFKDREQLEALHTSGKLKFRVDTLYMVDSTLNSDGSYDYFQTDQVSEVLVDVPYYSEGTQYGFVAQNVQRTFSELVSEDEVSGVLAVNYEGFIPILLEAIKLQQEQIESLEERLEALEGSQPSLGNIGTSARSLNSDDELNFDLLEGLLQNTPNPSENGTVIPYYLGNDTQSASIFIYDLQGNQIRTYDLSSEQSSLTIQSGELAAGMYTYSMVADGVLIDTKKMILTEQ